MGRMRQVQLETTCFLLAIKIVMRHCWRRTRNKVVVVHCSLTDDAMEIESITDVSEKQLLRVRYFSHGRFGAVFEPLDMSPLKLAVDVNNFRKPEQMNKHSNIMVQVD